MFSIPDGFVFGSRFKIENASISHYYWPRSKWKDRILCMLFDPVNTRVWYLCYSGILACSDRSGKRWSIDLEKYTAVHFCGYSTSGSIAYSYKKRKQGRKIVISDYNGKQLSEDILSERDYRHLIYGRIPSVLPRHLNNLSIFGIELQEYKITWKSPIHDVYYLLNHKTSSDLERYLDGWKQTGSYQIFQTPRSICVYSKTQHKCDLLVIQTWWEAAKLLLLSFYKKELQPVENPFTCLPKDMINEIIKHMGT